MYRYWHWVSGRYCAHILELGYNWPILTTFDFTLIFHLKSCLSCLVWCLKLVLFLFSFLSHLFLKVVFNVLYDNPDKGFELYRVDPAKSCSIHNSCCWSFDSISEAPILWVLPFLSPVCHLLSPWKVSSQINVLCGNK